MQRQSCLKDASYLREVVLADWNSGTRGMSQWETVLRNSYLPQPTPTKSLATSPPSQVQLFKGVIGIIFNYHRKVPISKVREGSFSFPVLFTAV